MTADDAPLPFWFDDGSPAHGASPSAIAAFENRSGTALPASFERLLLERDGGVSNYEAYHVGERYVPLPAIFSVDVMTRALDAAHHFGTPKGVVAFASGAHAWLGLDYRNSKDPAVVAQADDDAPIEPVAASFDEFLAGLVEE